ncbi:ribonuclease E activity regulator RraA [Amphibiibacter pelophylacis]|uniref:Ribonuclease E activity regulator RraA n=1 Tax=Amphibiibacter pelophylacis TaxID=1799477 RepID=A0ACC6P0Z5_9BURK
MNSTSTCDWCDAHKSTAQGPQELRVLALPWRSYGARATFSGPAVTVQALDDNSEVKRWLESPGEGRVLVVDGHGSMRRALLGGNMAASAARQGWAGVLVCAAVRDVAELALADVGIFALGTVPLPTERRGQGLSQIPVRLGGVTVLPGDLIVADADGVIALPPAFSTGPSMAAGAAS